VLLRPWLTAVVSLAGQRCLVEPVNVLRTVSLLFSLLVLIRREHNVSYCRMQLIGRPQRCKQYAEVYAEAQLIFPGTSVIKWDLSRHRQGTTTRHVLIKFTRGYEEGRKGTKEEGESKNNAKKNV